MQNYNLTIALLLSLFAGLSTGFGGLLVLLFRKTNVKFLSVSLGFSAGVMIYISFVEILSEANEYLIEGMGEQLGKWMAFLAFFAGIMLIALIDKLVPEPENPHVLRKLEDCEVSAKKQKLYKTGMLTALAITIHNFPEGLATFVSGMTDLKLGIAISIAVAIHNIPEGIAVAIPVYCATGSRKKAFLMSLLSGAAEPLGAIVAFLFLAPYINNVVFGIVFAAIAGIMVFISFDELLPTAREYGEHHLSILGLIAGMMVMGISLLLVF
jgi:ZIP family zinc transporter